MSKIPFSLGTGSDSLLGGDLTDPEDKVIPTDRDIAADLPEAELRPANATWHRMKCAPANGPGMLPHQRHPYQSWQGSPACAIFLNKPKEMKWYVGFKDGGYGGPTRELPYFVAIELKDAFVLTHFTITTSPEMPGRDPREWAVQGSNTGADDDWTDICVCNAGDREDAPFKEDSRCRTFLFTSFTTADLEKSVTARDAKKLNDRLAGRKIETAAFVRPPKTYTWFRIAVYSCFNPNSMHVEDFNFPPGFSMSQLELFGVPGAREEIAPGNVREARPKVPAGDVPFIISYWDGPPKEETTLERYREIVECGFNVAMPGIEAEVDWNNTTWGLGDAQNLKILDLCQQVGLKAMIWAGMPSEGDFRPPVPEQVPAIEKYLDQMIAKFGSHPALLGYVMTDEPGVDRYERLALIHDYLLRKDPAHLPYINLLPNYAAHPDWRDDGYERSISRFIGTVQPLLVCWDHYRQVFGDDGDETYYWQNLEIIRRQSLAANLPYLQIICALKHMGYRECSEADLRWQVWTSLAYGSRGIMYYTYWDVASLAWAGAPSIMTLDGKRDVKYDYVKRINHRIANLGPVLVGLVSTGVYCTDPLPAGANALSPEAPVRKAEGGAMVIGCFKDAAGNVYILPVNRSFTQPFTFKLTMADKICSMSEVSQETGKLLAAVPLKDKVLEVKLEAGEGRLFLLNSK